MGSVEVIFPYRPSDSHREAALRHVFGLYQAWRPEWGLKVSVDISDGPWSKGGVIWKAALRSRADILVIADADVWCNSVANAVQAVHDGALWAAPHVHGYVNRITREGTAAIYGGGDWKQPLLEQHRPMPGGGILVLPRLTYLQCPIDPRFLGWGQEDESWHRALCCLIGEPAPWGTDPLHHLWHPTPERLDRRHGSTEGWALSKRYRAAVYDRAAMQSLVEEALDDLQSHQ